MPSAPPDFPRSDWVATLGDLAPTPRVSDFGSALGADLGRARPKPMLLDVARAMSDRLQRSRQPPLVPPNCRQDRYAHAQ
jgi:hypothetical protein